MHDIKAIRDNPERYIAGWKSRGVDEAEAVVAEILALDVELRAAQTRGQDALAQRNTASKAIGAAMGRKDMAEADRLKAEAESLKGVIAEAESIEAEKGGALRDILAGLKNLAADDVPDGADEHDNVQVGDAFGTPRTTSGERSPSRSSKMPQTRMSAFAAWSSAMTVAARSPPPSCCPPRRGPGCSCRRGSGFQP